MNCKDIDMKDIYLACYSLIVRLHICVLSVMYYVDSLFFLLMYRPRWVVPVLPKGELEVLLEAAIDLCKKGNALFLGLVYHLIFLLFSFIVLLSSSRISITFICVILSFHF